MTTKWSTIKAAKGARPVFTVFAERDGRFWFLRVMRRPELFTQSVRLDQAEAMVRDLVATWDQVDPDSFDVRLRVSVDGPTDDAKDALDHLRLIEALGNDLRRALAVELTRTKGLSMRDAGKVIGLSHQRIAQLIAEHDAMGGDARPGVASVMQTLAQLTDHKAAITVRRGDDEALTEGIRKQVVAAGG